MSSLSSYPTKAFKESQKFLIRDPATGSFSYVLGSDLVSYITPRLNYVRSQSTRVAAENTDYKVGTVVQTTGGEAVGDEGSATFLVVSAGQGNFAMLNGNELLTINGVRPQNTITTLSNITSLFSLNTAALVDGQQFNVGSYLPDTSAGSALIRWRPDLPKSRHDGVLFFSLTVPMFTGDTTDYRNGVGETDPSGNGVMELVQGEIIYSTKVTIPTHFNDYQSALDRLVGSIFVKDGAEIDVELESGQSISSGFRLDDSDASFLRFTSADATAPLAAGFSPVSNQNLDAGVPRTNLIAFLGVRSKMPKWDLDVDATAASIVTGIELDWGSHIVTGIGKGVSNVSNGTDGIGLRCTTGSTWHGYQSKFSGCLIAGATVRSSAMASIAEIDLSNSGSIGLDVARGALCYALGANCSGAADYAVFVRRAYLSAQGINVSNSPLGIWGRLGSYIGAQGAIFDGCTNDVKPEDGSIIDVSGATKAGAQLSISDSTLRRFNQVFGDGLITNNDYVESSAECLNSDSSISTVSGDLQLITAGTYFEIYSSVSTARVVSGSIYGSDIGVRITVDGEVVLNDISRARGFDSGAADTVSVVNIPQIVAKSSISIEVYNRSGADSSVGWKIYVSA